MLPALTALYSNGTFRRIVWGVLATAIIICNAKFNLGLSDTAQYIIAGIAIALITGSNAKEAMISSVEAKAAGPVSGDVPGILQTILAALAATPGTPTPLPGMTVLMEKKTADGSTVTVPATPAEAAALIAALPAGSKIGK